MQLIASRTPPGVRELKPAGLVGGTSLLGRTPPGVRELKQLQGELRSSSDLVAPLPGCVN